jgi:hypothetical protein
VDTWVDGAQLFLAIETEREEEVDSEGWALRMESDLLGQAMQQSLAEDEARKKEVKPPVEMDGAELRGAFAGSQLLARIEGGGGGGGGGGLRAEDAVADPPLRRALVGYLVEEQRCKKWWPVSVAWFREAAEQLAAALQGCASPAAARPAKRRRKAPGAAARSPPAQEEGGAASPAVLDAARGFLEARLAALQSVYSYVDDGNGVPAIFADCPPLEVECVELLDE